MTPNWLIPFVGLSMAAGTGASLDLGEWTEYFFWIAFLSFLILFPVMLYRLHAYPEGNRAEAQYPYIAFPAALLLTSWIAMGGHQGHVLTHFLFLVQMCSIVLVSLRISNMFTMNFENDFSSLAFPSDISAKCSVGSILMLFFVCSLNKFVSLLSWDHSLKSLADRCCRFFTLICTWPKAG